MDATDAIDAMDATDATDAIDSMNLFEKFHHRNATVGVIGLGYVRPPLCRGAWERKSEECGELTDPPAFNSQTGDAAEVGNVLGNKGHVVNQGRGSHQDVGVADEVTLPMKIGIDIGARTITSSVICSR